MLQYEGAQLIKGGAQKHIVSYFKGGGIKKTLVRWKGRIQRSNQVGSICF